MTDESPFNHGHFANGPLADEAVRLIGAAQDWWQRTGSDKLNGIATGGPECCWCPVCQLIATLRGDRPELTERFAETQTAVSGLLRALADAVSGPAPAAKPEPVRLQRIDLERESD